jgi:regulatory protein
VKSRKTQISADPGIDPIEFARGIALNALSARPKSRRELELQLTKRGVTQENVKLALDRLASVGLVDDLEFARAWSHSRQRTKGLSRRVLAQELSAKGIDRSLAQGVLDEISADDEYQAALAIATKKARTTSNLSHDVQVRRIFDLLARKGFASSISSRIVRDVLKD